jgi:hypothetical protein
VVVRGDPRTEDLVAGRAAVDLDLRRASAGEVQAGSRGAVGDVEFGAQHGGGAGQLVRRSDPSRVAPVSVDEPGAESAVGARGTLVGRDVDLHSVFGVGGEDVEGAFDLGKRGCGE